MCSDWYGYGYGNGKKKIMHLSRDEYEIGSEGSCMARYLVRAYQIIVAARYIHIQTISIIPFSDPAT